MRFVSVNFIAREQDKNFTDSHTTVLHVPFLTFAIQFLRRSDTAGKVMTVWGRCASTKL